MFFYVSIHYFDVSEIQLKDAISEIEHLNPKPGGSYSGNNRIVEHIVPDFAIKIIDGEVERAWPIVAALPVPV